MQKAEVVAFRLSGSSPSLSAGEGDFPAGLVGYAASDPQHEHLVPYFKGNALVFGLATA